MTALRAFEATARLGTLTRAAVELNVTHAAISHQLRVLEEFIGTEVFRRVGRRVELSEAGHLLLPILNSAFRQVEETIAELSPRPRRADVDLVMPPVFTARWLMPRLGRLRARHPQVDVRLVPSRVPVSPASRGTPRLVVACGVGGWRGADARLLLPVLLEPICSPATARECELREPADVARATLLDTDLDPNATHGADWRAWMAAAGINAVDIPEHEALRDAGLAVQAALDGLGVVLADRNLCADELDDGRLCAPFRVRYRHAFSYWLLSARSGMDEASAAVHDWLLEEADRSPNNPLSVASVA